MAAQTLVSAKWLANLVKNNRVGHSLRVLDSSWYLPMMKRDGKKEFARTHIPGASFFDIDECSDRDSPFDHMIPTERYFADYVGNLGIGNKTHVVVYDASDFGAFTSTRVWWMFRAFGHSQVSVLDGGFRNWVHEGHTVSEEYSMPARTEFTASLNQSWVKSFEDVRDNIATQQFQVVDVRDYGRFSGRDPEPRESIKPGHIPGSKCLPFLKVLDASGMMLPPEELEKLFQNAGVDLKRPMCVSCGSGVTACHLILAAHLCGYPGASLYDGSWYEWFTRAAPEHIISEAQSKL